MCELQTGLWQWQAPHPDWKPGQAQARRIAVRAQLLDAPRPTELLAVVQQLTLRQIDPTAAIAPSADLVAWSRLCGDPA